MFNVGIESLSVVLKSFVGLDGEAVRDVALNASVHQILPEFVRQPLDRQVDFLCRLPDFVRKNFLSFAESNAEMRFPELADAASARLVALSRVRLPDVTADLMISAIKTFSEVLDKVDPKKRDPNGLRQGALAPVGEFLESISLSVIVLHAEELRNALVNEKVFQGAVRCTPSRAVELINEMDRAQLGPGGRSDIFHFLLAGATPHQAAGVVGKILAALPADQKKAVLVAHLGDIVGDGCIDCFPDEPRELVGKDRDFLSPLKESGVTVVDLIDGFAALYDSHLTLADWPHQRETVHPFPRDLAASACIDFVACVPALQYVFGCSLEEIVRERAAQNLVLSFLKEITLPKRQQSWSVNSDRLDDAIKRSLPTIKTALEQGLKMRDSASGI